MRQGPPAAVYRDGQFVPRVMLPLCVAYDHRLIDGADGARFANEIVKVLGFSGDVLGRKDLGLWFKFRSQRGVHGGIAL